MYAFSTETDCDNILCWEMGLRYIYINSSLFSSSSIYLLVILNIVLLVFILNPECSSLK